LATSNGAVDAVALAELGFGAELEVAVDVGAGVEELWTDDCSVSAGVP
jgi:hypothetical protein